MWKGYSIPPHGRVSLRSFLTYATIILVSCFAWFVLGSAPVQALDAKWSGESLVYDDITYSGPVTAVQNDRSTLSEGTIYFHYTDGEDAKLISFPKATDLKTAAQATFQTAKYDARSDTFTGLSPPETITIDSGSFGSEPDPIETSCGIEAIGWIVCPVSTYIAEGMDFIYGLIEGFFTFNSLADKGNVIYDMWNIVRNIANAMFVIGFLVLIYAQITGAVMSNYTIKKIMPRIVIAAVLVNISFWICALAVDLSNVIGAAVYDLFTSFYSNLANSNPNAEQTINWKSITLAILGGGTLVVGGAIGTIALIGGGIGAASLMLLAAAIPAIFAVFVAIVILAARQALIMLLIVISPIAFVMYLLPNTEDWFNRWKKFFITLLVFYPAFAVVFSASQVAGLMIMQTAPNIPVALLGLLVQVVPLFITPILIKLSSGMLGTIAGMANDRSKGVFDRTQNWAKAGAAEKRSKAMAKRMNPNVTSGRFRNARSRTTRKVSKKAAELMNRGEARKLRTEAYSQQLQAQYLTHSRAGQKLYKEKSLAATYQEESERYGKKRFLEHAYGQQISPDNKMDGRRRRDGRLAELGHRIHESHYAHEEADTLKNAIDKEGERKYKERLVSAPDGSYDAFMRQTKTKAVIDSKRAETADSIIQKGGEEQYFKLVQNSGQPQDMYVKGFKADKLALKAEGQVNQLMADMQLKGSLAFGSGTSQGTLAIADEILAIRESSAIAKARLKASENIIEQQNEAFWQKAMLDENAPMHEQARETRLLETLATKQAERATEDTKDFLAKVNYIGQKALDDSERGKAVATFMKDETDRLTNPELNITAGISHENTTLGAIAEQISGESLSKQLATESIKSTQDHESDTYTNIIRGTAEDDTDGVITEEISKKLRHRGAGINVKGESSEYGEGRLLGRSRKEKSARLMENTENSESTLSETILSDLQQLRDDDGFILPILGRKATPEERYAADIQVITKKGNLAAVIDALDKNARKHGMVFDHTVGKFYIPKRDEWGVVMKEKVISPDTGEEVDRIMMADGTDYLTAAEAEDHSDAQQMNMYGYQKGHQKSAIVSGTHQGMAQTGQRYHTTADAMIEEWGGGKMSAQGFADAKIDDWLSWIRLLRQQGFRDKHFSNPTLREKMVAQIRTAQQNPNLEDRIRRVMSATMNYLELPNGTDTSSVAVQERLETKFKYITKKDHTGQKFQVWMPQQDHPGASPSSVYNEDTDYTSENVTDGKRVSDQPNFKL
ncbi:oligosaccharide repeat unit polymerase [Candidatus Saccharibacteria bacterium]|nr:oligosaccharide repeat unit polymerase [Candidatus Saccharibacteria bacterium]